MIKINLIGGNQKSPLSNIAGFDLTKVRVVPVILAFGLMYAPDFTLLPMLDEQVAAANQALTDKQTELTQLRGKISKSKNLEKQIQDLKHQEEDLEKKLTAVKQAISEKRNPSALLLYIAKNTPKELWIKELQIEKNDLLIKGEAEDYTSIGNFVNSLRSSVFISNANIASTSSIVRDSDKKRIEVFEVKFVISRFNQ